MKTKAIRLYGVNDLRLEEFDLPEIKDDEILARVVSDSICMSSFKAAEQGADHKRVPNDVATNPVIIGHEFCGDIVKVGKKWQGKFKEGSKQIKAYIESSPQDENTKNLLAYLGELTKEVNGKKYGLVFEEHRETIDEILEKNLFKKGKKDFAIVLPVLIME